MLRITRPFVREIQRLPLDSPSTAVMDVINKQFFNDLRSHEGQKQI